MTQAVKRACDACHRRKVKCDGMNPCRNCGSAQLGCTYNAIPQKKGPKGSRAKVISELRETQRQTSLSTKVQNRINGIANPPPSPSLRPTPGLVTGEMIKDCIDFFFTNMYAQIPIIERRQVEQSVMFMETNPDAYCMLTTLCAFTLLQPGKAMPVATGDTFSLDGIPGANITSSTLLVEEALRVRKSDEYIERAETKQGVTLNTLATNYFLFACSYALEMHSRAWYYLREASTLMLMSDMHKEETYHQWDPVEASRKRRLYWLFYIAERAYAIQRHRPLTLQATINLPSVTDDPSDPLGHQANNLILQANIFRMFDDKLTTSWVQAKGSFTPQYVSSLQKQLTEVVRSFVSQDPQVTDLSTNQGWLKSTHWRLTSEESISYQFSMAQETLMAMASHFPHIQGVDLMTSGLIEKLVEVAHLTMDYLSMQAPSRDPFSMGPREQLSHVLNIVAVVRNGCNQFVPLLMHKLNDIVPRLINPMLQNAPEDAPMPNIDLFDYSGNVGMSQPMQMQMDTEYDRKFSASEYEKKFDMNSTPPESTPSQSSNGPSSQRSADLNPQFVNSPAIMSPGLEYPHGMSDYACSPMAEMVMSPISAGPNSMNPQQGQHHSMQSFNSLGQQPPNMGGINPQSLHNNGIGNMPNSHAMGSGGGGSSGMIARQPPQRTNSFVMSQQPPPPQQQQGQPMPRTVGDFQALQRANSDSSSTMNQLAGMGMGAEIDFSGLR